MVLLARVQKASLLSEMTLPRVSSRETAVLLQIGQHTTFLSSWVHNITNEPCLYYNCRGVGWGSSLASKMRNSSNKKYWDRKTTFSATGLLCQSLRQDEFCHNTKHWVTNDLPLATSHNKHMYRMMNCQVFSLIPCATCFPNDSGQRRQKLF